MTIVWGGTVAAQHEQAGLHSPHRHCGFSSVSQPTTISKMMRKAIQTRKRTVAGSASAPDRSRNRKKSGADEQGNEEGEHYKPSLYGHRRPAPSIEAGFEPKVCQPRLL